MENAEDKHWASKYLLDPLHGSDPSQETGPGSHFRPDSETSSLHELKTASSPTSPPNKLTKRPPSRRSPGSFTSDIGPKPTGLSQEGGNVTRSRNNTTSSQTSPFPPVPSSPQQTSSTSPVQTSPSSQQQEAFSPTNRPRRTSSLTARFPGDNSHRPLATLAAEKHVADRSRHMTKKHHIGPDTIDALDSVGPGGISYHHGGPYDVTLFARNNSYVSSPVHALRESNAEALKATPADKILDSLRGHRPLDGTAAFPPGTVDRGGHVYAYEEGENMMVGNDADKPAGGAYKRWPGMQYDTEDIKGKGEPSYSVEKAIKDGAKRDRESWDGKPAGKNANNGVGADGIELTTRPKSSGAASATATMSHARNVSGGSVNHALGNEMWGDGEEGGIKRSTSMGKRWSGSAGLKKRIGSIKRHLQSIE